MKKLILMALGFGLSACSGGVLGQYLVSFKMELPNRSTLPKSLNIFEQLNFKPGLGTFALPASAANFDCYALHVVGPGVPNQLADFFPDDVGFELVEKYSEESCLYPGISTRSITATDVIAGQALELFVPAGPQRLVQVVGLMGYSGVNSCGSQHDTVSTLFAQDYRNGGYTGGPNFGNYDDHSEIGRTVIDIFQDVSVNITGNYNSSDQREVFCEPDFSEDLEIPDGGLFAHFESNEIVQSDGTNVNTWFDRSGENNDIAGPLATNEPTFRTEINSGITDEPALEFDGVDDRLVVTPVSQGPTGASDFTFAVVVRYLAGPGIYSDVFGYGSVGTGMGVFLRTTNGTGWEFGVDTGASVLGGNEDDNNYHLMVITYDAGTGDITLYQDGSQVNQVTVGALSLTNNELALGNRYGASGNPFDGNIAAFAAYDWVLDSGAMGQLKCAWSNQYGLGLSGC